MAELLTHVFSAYVLATLLSWRYNRVRPPLVTVAMIGAILPDLSRLEWVVSSRTVESLIGLPFSWSPIHYLGGSVLLVLIAGLAVEPRYRGVVIALLSLGIASHYVLDIFLFRSTGRTLTYLWPLTDYRFAVDGFYRSPDRWPAVVSGFAAAVVWVVSRRRESGPA